MESNVEIVGEGPAFTYLPDLQFKDLAIQNKSHLFWKKRTRSYPSHVWLNAYYGTALQERAFPKVVIRYVDDAVGYGLFAGENLPPLTLVGEYTGIVRRKNRGENKSNKYLLRYPIGFFSFTRWVIDAEKQGNYTRFINHSTQNNVCIKSMFHNGQIRMVVITTKSVAKGEQFLLDYGKLYWKQLGVMPRDLSL